MSTPPPSMDGDTRDATWVRIDDLHIDPSYSRAIVAHRANKIAAEFDPDSFGAVVVSKRANGELFILDGTHRMAALKKLGWNDQLVPAIVLTGLSVAEEARVFTTLNEQRAKPRSTDLYRSKLASNDSTAVAIDQIVRSLGLHVGAGALKNQIQAVTALESIWTNANRPEVTLYSVLWTIRKAWNGEGGSFQAPLLIALALVYNRHEIGPTSKVPELMSQTLGHEDHALNWVNSFKAIKSATGRQGGLGTRIGPELILERYNRRRTTNRLPEPWLVCSGKRAWRTHVDLIKGNGDDS